MRDSLTTRQSLGSQLCHTEFLAMLAEALARSEHVEDGVVTLDEAISLAKSSGERYFESEIYRLKGELLLQLSSSCSTEAEKLLRQAIDVAQKQSAKSFELRAASSLSRLLYQQGRAEEARQALRGIGGWFTEGFDTPDLQEAKELLERA